MVFSVQNSDLPGYSFAKIIVFSGLTSAYLTTRLPGLTVFPIFTDEAMYIHIAQIIDSNWDNLFLGKVNAFKPLFLWFLALYQNIFSDPVVAGRLASVTMGLGSMFGVYFLGRELFSERVGQVSAVIYIFCPYFIFHERLVLMDTMVNTFGVWTVWISFRIARGNELVKTSFVLLGILLGLAFFTKSTALAFFPAPFVIFFLWKTYNRTNFWIYVSLTFLIIALINLPYFLTDQKVGYALQHAVFSGTHLYIPLKSLLGFPVEIWSQNIFTLFIYLLIYLTFPIFLVVVFGIFYALVNKNKVAITLILLFMIPALIIMLVGKTIYARYYLEIIPPIIILSGWALVQLTNYASDKLVLLNPSRANIFLIVLIICVISEGITFSETLKKKPLEALIPDIDRVQYLLNPRSGYGIKEAKEFLISESKKGPIDVFTWMAQGNPQDGIMIYLWGQPKINIIPANWLFKIKKVFPQGEKFPVYPSKYQWLNPRMDETKGLTTVYFVAPIPGSLRNLFLENNPEWKKVWSFNSPSTINSLEIFRLAR